jgi:hypothetical protein
MKFQNMHVKDLADRYFATEYKLAEFSNPLQKKGARSFKYVCVCVWCDV